MAIRSTLDIAKKNTPTGNIYKTTIQTNSPQSDGQLNQIQLAKWATFCVKHPLWMDIFG